MDLKFKKITRTKQFHSFLYRFIRFYSWTFRIKVENEQKWMERLNSGGRVILCTWHQQFFSAIRHFQNYRNLKPALMISQSRDGEMIAAVAERSGWQTVRGSSSNGGKHALRQLVEHLQASGLAAHILDGPRGPAGEVKAGLISMAHSADASIVPFYTSADRSWFFNSWDHFFLPKPFARVTISFGEPIALEKIGDESAFEDQRAYIEKLMRPGLKRPH